ncbi:MAG TPA: hypothetical protein VNI01_10690 [Elusimicrobiota bacterium]|nr:hypothetical protein [Elusimicrobiota bacterium]
MRTARALLAVALLSPLAPRRAWSEERRRPRGTRPEPRAPAPPTNYPAPATTAPASPSPSTGPDAAAPPAGADDCAALAAETGDDRYFAPHSWNGGPIFIDPRKAAEMFKNRPGYCGEYRAELRKIAGWRSGTRDRELAELSEKWAKRVWESAYPNPAEAALVHYVASQENPQLRDLPRMQREIVYLTNTRPAEDGVGRYRAQAAQEARNLLLVPPQEADRAPAGRWLKSKVGADYSKHLLPFYCANEIDPPAEPAPGPEALPQARHVRRRAPGEDGKVEFDNADRRRPDVYVDPNAGDSPLDRLQRQCSTYRKSMALQRPSGPNQGYAGSSVPAPGSADAEKKKSSFWADVGKDAVGAAFGAVAGALIGFVFGGPVGAVIGAAIGGVAMAGVVHLSNHPPGGGGS